VLSEKIKIKREGQTDDDDECKVMTKPVLYNHEGFFPDRKSTTRSLKVPKMELSGFFF
jgi:hypothetical protein